MYDEVLEWAEWEFHTNNSRAPNGKPLHLNFPAALKKWVERK
jgi:hypothetical protein